MFPGEAASGFWKHFDKQPTTIVHRHSISYRSELVGHKHANIFAHNSACNIFPHNVPDDQSLLTKQVIRDMGFFHNLSMIYFSGLLTLATRWQPLNNKFLICVCVFLIVQSFFRKKFYITLLCFRISVSK